MSLCKQTLLAREHFYGLLHKLTSTFYNSFVYLFNYLKDSIVDENEFLQGGKLWHRFFFNQHEILRFKEIGLPCEFYLAIKFEMD